MNAKNIVLFFLGGSFVAGTLFTLVGTDAFNVVKGEECEHQLIEEYDAYAPTLENDGEMHHFACCQCHIAWQDISRTVEIGHTLIDRSKIEITKKSQKNSLAKSDISATNDIILVNESHIYGLDQTNWGPSNGGVGGGNASYFIIDGKESLRISSENLTSDQRTSLDYTNYGYSEIGFNKHLTGTITARFDYKIYDLDVSKFNGESRVQATWLAVDGQKYSSDMELITDNNWHTVIVSSNEKIEINEFALKIHHFSGEMYMSNLTLTATGLDFPRLYREGGSVKWESVPEADYYVVNDSNNNPSTIEIDASEAQNNIFSYKPTAAGKHNIYVTAYTRDGSYDPASSNIIEGVEVNPVFFYDNMINKYEISKNAEYTDNQINQVYNSSTWNDLGDRYSSYFTDQGTFTKDAANRLRFNSTVEGSNLYRIVQEAKELGTNVLHVSHDDGYLNGRFEDESNAELRTIMDFAHANNLKVTVIVNEIYDASARGPSESEIRRRVSNYLSANARGLLEHPAFYGFALRDEPPREGYGQIQSVEYVAWTARAILDYYEDNRGVINFSTERPFFVCDLLQFGGSNIFHCEYDYENYVETWLRITGLDYFSTDIYTYTTQQKYGDHPEAIDINYNIFMQLKKRYKPLKMHLTTTSNNDVFARDNCNQYDIFGSTLYAAALNNYGISRYTYYPAMHTYHWSNGVVQRNGAKTSKYGWVKEAQEQFEFVQDKLYDYEPTALSYETDGAYGDKSGGFFGWGGDLTTNRRRMDITLSDGFNEATMIVNYNSQEKNVDTFTITVPQGKMFYYFGQGKDYSGSISTGNSVTLSNGQAVLIMEANPNQVIDGINQLIETANGLNTNTNRGKAQFTLLAGSIEQQYGQLASDITNKVQGYDEFSVKQTVNSKRAEILYDEGYNYGYAHYDRDASGNKVNNTPTFSLQDSLNANPDPMFGEMQTYDWGTGSQVQESIQLNFNATQVGKDWTSYEKIGFFIRYSAPTSDLTYLIPNDDWGAWIYNAPVLVDAETNLYYYEFDISTLTGAFDKATYFQIYFDKVVGINKIEISSIVGFKPDYSQVESMIERALSLPTNDTKGTAQFLLYSARLNDMLDELGSNETANITGYSEFKTKYASVNNASVIYDSFFSVYNPGSDNDWPEMELNESADYGYMHTFTYAQSQVGGARSIFINNASYNNWTAYGKIGFFAQFDNAINDNAYFVMTDGWGITSYCVPKCVDSVNNVYYYEFDISNAPQSLMKNPEICLYIGGGISNTSIGITDIIGFNK